MDGGVILLVCVTGALLFPVAYLAASVFGQPVRTGALADGAVAQAVLAPDELVQSTMQDDLLPATSCLAQTRSTCWCPRAPWVAQSSMQISNAVIAYGDESDTRALQAVTPAVMRARSSSCDDERGELCDVRVIATPPSPSRPVVRPRLRPSKRMRALSRVALCRTAQARRRAGGPRDSTRSCSSVAAPEPLAAYVHIPFCRRRCFYCDFPIQVVGDNTTGAAVSAAVDEYVSAVCADVAASVGGPALESVFFGGGTPSLLPPQQLGRILGALQARFGLAPGCEVSLEADPGTFDQGRLSEYVALGVSRLNVGVQSFDAAMLKACGRAHSVGDVEAALEAVRGCGVQSWGLDLIGGLPGLTQEVWAHTLRTTAGCGAPHVSVYDLQVEAGTAFGRWYAPGVSPLPSHEAAADMYRAAHEALSAAGYEHYEVSNFARPGHQCQHNLRYWRNQSWHAFGVAAANHVGGRRTTRPRRLRDYLRWVREGGELEGEAGEPLLDSLMMGLRLAEGLDVRGRFGQTTGLRVESSLAAHVAAGRVSLQGGRVRLTAPEGFLLSNSVISDAFAALPTLYP